MWKKIKENWKTYLLVILSALFGADQAQEFGLIAGTPGPPVNQPRPERPGDTPEEPAPDLYEVVASFEYQRGGPGTPAYMDDLGPVTFEVVKPRPDIVESVFKDKYGALYPFASLRKFVVTKRPAGAPEPDEPDEVTE